jgi:preprotein translocase subunit SecE
LSSQEQAPGYKRRSSGKRTRRPAQATTAVVAPPGEVEGEAVVEGVAPESPRQSRRNGTTTSAMSATTRTRSEVKAGPADTTSKWQQLVNLDRFEGLRKFIRETWAEIKKVIWPDREATRNLTLVVIAVSVVLGILLGGIDYVLYQLFEALP